MTPNFYHYNNIVEFGKNYEGKVFRLWVKKKMFTPYEIDAKFIDQPIYEVEEAEFVIIKEAIMLPDGDVLIGYVPIDDNIESFLKEDYAAIFYEKLSNIDLAYYEKDTEEFTDDNPND